jgi:Mo-co oxidoreductase dimerisation domain
VFITAVAEPFEGFQQMIYRFRHDPDDEGEPVSRMHPRSLMTPPGIPDFLTRRRFVEIGRHLLRGRARSGWAPVERVEVSTDGGESLADATVGEATSPFEWVPFAFAWEASEPGEFEPSCRATDTAGNTQPLEQPWNYHGFANTMVQRVPVEVRPGVAAES